MPRLMLILIIHHILFPDNLSQAQSVYFLGEAGRRSKKALKEAVSGLVLLPFFSQVP